MRGLVLVLTIGFISVLFTDSNAQRYRNGVNLGDVEFVSFVAMKNGDIVEFNWKINSTREITSIELVKGNLNDDNIEWVTVKEIMPEDKRYIDYLPDLGMVLYKLILTDSNSESSEYEPEFKVKEGVTPIL